MQILVSYELLNTTEVSENMHEILSISFIITVTGLVVAIWQLKLQRDEVKRDVKINSLIYLTNYIKDKIIFHEKIISDLKRNNKNWRGHEKVVNKELRPMLKSIEKELLRTILTQNKYIDKDKFNEIQKYN